jgi:peptide/nickel transport system ATP-binding protein
MYLGRIVEVGDAHSVYSKPQHPYTRALLDSVPRLSLAGNIGVTFLPIRGELPSPLSPPSGCAFHPRCLKAAELCREERPRLENSGNKRLVACHYK